MPERANQQSAAEFFAEHQQIAGFDNAGKSLFTTIREFVENSLDAAESINELPDITVTVKEFSETEHNTMHGIKKGKKVVPKKNSSSSSGGGNDDGYGNNGATSPLLDSLTNTQEEHSPNPDTTKSGKQSNKEAKEQSYYEVTCSDNGCGIEDSNIGDMLGKCE